MSTISPTNDFFKNIDLLKRKEKIINQITKKIPFIPLNKKVWESKYWHKGIGSFQVEGYFKKGNKRIKSILKIQGAKPDLPEPKIINLFNKQNKSQIIKTPNVLFYLPWNNQLKFETYVFEKIKANFIIEPNKPADKNRVEEFFSVYKNYKDKAVIKPFIKKPNKKPIYINHFKKWRKIRKTHSRSWLINFNEEKKLYQVAKKLNQFFEKTPLEFQHKHLSVYDIKKKNKDYYLFSHLFWGWNYPLYDAFLGFEWHILSLSYLTPTKIIAQINLWLSTIKKTLEESQYVNRNYKDNWQKFFHLAIVERLTAGLNLDILLIPEKNNILKIKSVLWKILEKHMEKLNSI